jgi:hypothetical protein
VSGKAPRAFLNPHSHRSLVYGNPSILTLPTIRYLAIPASNAIKTIVVEFKHGADLIENEINAPVRRGRQHRPKSRRSMIVGTR